MIILYQVQVKLATIRKQAAMITMTMTRCVTCSLPSAMPINATNKTTKFYFSTKTELLSLIIPLCLSQKKSYFGEQHHGLAKNMQTLRGLYCVGFVSLGAYIYLRLLLSFNVCQLYISISISFVLVLLQFHGSVIFLG